MYDNSLHFAQQAQSLAVAEKHGVSGNYVLATCHRPSNTDSTEALHAVLGTLLELSAKLPVVLPLHPRTRARLESLAPELLQRMELSETLHVIPPVSFLEMIDLEARCSLVMTDSGGVQKEAFFFRKPCVILREETEWVEIVENGNALLAGANAERIRASFDALRSAEALTYPAFYGDGRAAEFIAERILDSLA
jgi:UDP-GlcNAc3NAcA epimerase